MKRAAADLARPFFSFEVGCQGPEDRRQRRRRDLTGLNENLTSEK
ncbi:MAG: hypothetical protein WBY88_00435 [Desulfosarcina sp.]